MGDPNFLGIATAAVGGVAGTWAWLAYTGRTVTWLQVWFGVALYAALIAVDFYCVFIR